MSRPNHQSTRTRSHSTSRPAPKQSFPEESPQKQPKKPLSKGPLKTEDRLFNYQAQANRRLEALKQSLEQEKLKDMQTKPKILKKSRQLAEIHDKKYFPPEENIKDQENCEKIMEPLVEVGERVENPPQITVESVPFTSPEKGVGNRRTKSVQIGSVIAKSKEWYSEKMEKPNGQGEKKDLSQDSSFAEYTFSAQPSRKVVKKLDTGVKCIKDEISTPQSVETYADSVDHQKLIKNVQKILAPYQVKVSFECGLDLNRFIKRACGEIHDDKIKEKLSVKEQ